MVGGPLPLFLFLPRRGDLHQYGSVCVCVCLVHVVVITVDTSTSVAEVCMWGRRRGVKGGQPEADAAAPVTQRLLALIPCVALSSSDGRHTRITRSRMASAGPDETTSVKAVLLKERERESLPSLTPLPLERSAPSAVVSMCTSLPLHHGHGPPHPPQAPAYIYICTAGAGSSAFHSGGSNAPRPTAL